MYSLYGFITIPGFIDNQTGSVAALGELSPEGVGYSREIGTYTLADYPGVALISLSSMRENAKVPVDPNYVTQTLKLAKWLYDQAIKGAITSDRDVTLQAVRAEFKDVLNITDMGDMVTHNRYWLPEFIAFSVVDAGGEQNANRVWFSNDSFLKKYPLFEIEVVLPVDHIDDLLQDRAACLALLKAINIETHNRRVQSVIKGVPHTYRDDTYYDWTDRDNPEVTQPAPFTTIIWGRQGINIDHQKDAIVDKILSESSSGRDVWEKVFPDLFTPTEFYIAPIWDRYSLPNETLVTGVYSPTLPYREVLTYAAKAFQGYAAEYIQNNVAIAGSTYKSLAFIAIGNEKNRHAEKRFEDQWPHYCAISTQAADFPKIDPETQAFIMLLFKMFIECESATEYSDIPDKMTRTKRGDITYLTATMGKVQYLMPIRANYLKA